MTGTILLWVAFLSSLFGMLMYFRTATGASKSVREARWGNIASAGSVIIASVLLMMYIFQHRFEYEYVYGYSSRDLPDYLLMTTFWAGQEGSFLLWALCAALFGLVLQSFARKQRTEARVMTIYGIVQTSLLFILLFKSPFTMIWDAYPGQIAVGQVPPDGKGLNPLLQNMWMAIHPPILFIGFASLAVPFALAVAALWGRMFQDWTRIAFPWVLFAVVALGTGIMLGGYWAYGVLGWGGWWGWDPVENSSLIPWFVAATLLHTLIVQMKNGGFVRTNFVLTILAYVLVVYSTFLTRSGVLGEASVHSFTDPGTFVYSLLLLWVVGMLAVGLLMLRSRWKDLRPSGAMTGILRKDTMLGWTTAILVLLTAMVFVGTNWPIIANASVEPAFYNKSALPFGILLALLLGVSLALQWEEVPLAIALRRMMVPFGLSVVLVIALLVAGVTDVMPLVFSLTSAFAFFMNVRALYQRIRIDWWSIGGPIAHAGVGILFLGIIGSGFYSRTETVSLPLGQAKEVLGQTLTYTGAQEREGKWYFTVIAGMDATKYELVTGMYHSDYNNSTMRTPDYVTMLTKDIYLEPISVDVPEQAPVERPVHLRKGQTDQVGPFAVTFRKFEMQQHANESMMAGAGMRIGAVLEIREGKKKGKTVTVISSFEAGSVAEMQPYRVNDTLEIRFVGMNIDTEGGGSTVILSTANPAAPVQQGVESLVVEASVKPFMSLVWLGAFVSMAGVAVAVVRRKRDLDKRDVTDTTA